MRARSLAFVAYRLQPDQIGVGSRVATVRRTRAWLTSSPTSKHAAPNRVRSPTNSPRVEACACSSCPTARNTGATDTAIRSCGHANARRNRSGLSLSVRRPRRERCYRNERLFAEIRQSPCGSFADWRGAAAQPNEPFAPAPSNATPMRTFLSIAGRSRQDIRALSISVPPRHRSFLGCYAEKRTEYPF